MREKLPARRHAEVIGFTHRLSRGEPQPHIATVGFFADGRIGEVFIDLPKVSNDASNLAHDLAVVLSIALQHGASIEEMRTAVGRAEDGAPHSLAGSALDMLADEQKRVLAQIAGQP